MPSRRRPAIEAAAAAAALEEEAPAPNSSSAPRRRRTRRGRRRGSSTTSAAMATAALALCAGRRSAAAAAAATTAAVGAFAPASRQAAFATASSARNAGVGPLSVGGTGRQRWRQPRRCGEDRSGGATTTTSLLRMATDSRELRFFAGVDPASAAAAACVGGGAGVGIDGADTSAVFASSSFRRNHVDQDDGIGREFSHMSVAAVKFSRSSPLGATAACFSTTVSSSAYLSSLSSPGADDHQPLRSSPSGGRPPAAAIDGRTIDLSDEERELFKLLSQVVQETHLTSTLRVAGGWVRDKLLATDEFRRGRGGLSDFMIEEDEDDARGGTNKRRVERLTSKFKSKVDGLPLGVRQPSAGRQGTKVVGSCTEKDGRLKARDCSVLADDDDCNGDPETCCLIQHCHPVDIDVALDDMLGREFADHLNDWLSEHGRQRTAVGVVLKNPEKSKHLETATMKVGEFWVDFVNLRAEEYTSDSRIPDLMRIGTAEEDAYRRDLTINALFYNVNTGRVEDWTGRGFDDLRRGVVATPLPPLTTLLDDPLRVLRSVRFAARLRFAMDDDLREAARDVRVREALAQKVARERVGSEVDLMLRSPDPVGAMRLLINLRLADTVFPVGGALPEDEDGQAAAVVLSRGLSLLSTTHDHLLDCKARPPLWCESRRAQAALGYGASEATLIDDEEARRLLWYASFLKPFRDASDRRSKVGKTGARSRGKKANRSAVTKLLVDELKRPLRDAEAAEKIMKAADDFTALMDGGFDAVATALLVGEVTVRFERSEECGGGAVAGEGAETGAEHFVGPDGGCYDVRCEMRPIDYNDGKNGANGCGDETKVVDSVTETDPLWRHAMEFRLLASKVLGRAGTLWRAALVLSLSERLAKLQDEELSYAIEGDYMDQDFEEIRRGIVGRYDAFAAALQQLGLIGIWYQKPLIDGVEMKGDVLRNIPKGPVFREIMDEQETWMMSHPGGGKGALVEHMRRTFPEFVE